MSLKSAGRIKASEKTNAPPSSAGHVCRMNISFRHGILCACALLLLLSVFVGSGAAIGGNDGNIQWDLTNGTLTISGKGGIPDFSSSSLVPWGMYRDSITKLVINSGVTSIGTFAFYGFSNLESVEIPDSVVQLSSNAFYNCSSLESVNIPSGVTSVPAYAFYGCSSLRSVTFSEGSHVNNIGDYAFYNCSSLESINLPSVDSIDSSVGSIGSYAFYGCSNLTSVDLPESVTSIGSYAFYGCSSISSVSIHPKTRIGERAFSFLAENSIIYCDETTVKALSDNYLPYRTALAENKGDNKYTFISTLPSLSLNEANAYPGKPYGGWYKDAAFTQQVTSVEKGIKMTLWLKTFIDYAVIEESDVIEYSGIDYEWVVIDSVADVKEGAEFTITGTTNIDVGTIITIEVKSTRFPMLSKDDNPDAAYVTGTAKVVQGDANINTFAVTFRNNKLNADTYFVTAKSASGGNTVYDTISMSIIGEGGQEPTPTPASPGLGVILVLAGLGAAAFLQRRN